MIVNDVSLCALGRALHGFDADRLQGMFALCTRKQFVIIMSLPVRVGNGVSVYTCPNPKPRTNPNSKRQRVPALGSTNERVMVSVFGKRRKNLSNCQYLWLCARFKDTVPIQSALPAHNLRGWRCVSELLCGARLERMAS
jgi:hypothetical protein